MFSPVAFIIRKNPPLAVIERVWGTETWIVNDTIHSYCGRMLKVNKGLMCSSHYHREKQETLYLFDGLVHIEADDVKEVLYPGESITIPSNRWHRFFGLRDSMMFDSSNLYNQDDIVRRSESGTFDLDELLRQVGLIGGVNERFER